MDRTILHCDCNSFFASVESVLHPNLREVPMAVCGNPENRHGIILAKNELAKKYDIRTAETIWSAKRKCPALVLVTPHHKEYAKFSEIINRIYERYSDLVEPFGIDESWLDVTGTLHLFGNGKTIADEIRETVKKETKLTISVGVSFNKVFAKLGSDYKKPDATTVISRENFKSIVWSLPVSALLYVGKSATETLRRIQITTIGELANGGRERVSSKLGKLGDMIFDYANGIDDSPVKSAYEKHEVKSIGNGMTFRRNLIGINDIKIGVNALSDEVATRMRKYGIQCGTVQVTIKDTNLKSITRQKALQTPTHLSREIADAAMELISGAWKMDKPIRMLTITGSNLVSADTVSEQLSLFEDEGYVKRGRHEKIEGAIDNIRDKFGKNAISTGSLLNNDLGIGTQDDES